MRHRFWRAVLLAFLWLTACGPVPCSSEDNPVKLEGSVTAPEFPAGAQWLNTGHPLTLKELRGKIVLLDFWTYCCINCMHIIPDLKKLEAKYKSELVVIGVHSAKFKNEKDSGNIREAVLRYGVEHPVINDADFSVWQSYAVNAWPTLVLIDPTGKVVTMRSGEGVYGPFDQVIGEMVNYFGALGKLSAAPLQFAKEKDKKTPGPLSFPGKIAADAASDRLFISDSGHHRILVTSLAGKVMAVIGSGEQGLKDGPFEQAEFFHPQGLCFDAAGDSLFIADTENHAIRRADLKTKQVSTIAGTGRQAQRSNVEGKGVDLNSPWDVLKAGDRLFIAMAGAHQVWTLDLESGDARVFAGSGAENIVDGPLKDSVLAQTSGLATDESYLYFADSETSSVRRCALDGKGNVETLIGEGLFEFGDKDGKYPSARLQHPIGVAWHDGAVYVADTYNHKVKKLDPEKKEVVSLIGTGKRGLKDGAAAHAQLNEPNGLAFAGGKMFIADTNNHRIAVYDMKSGLVSTLKITGLGEPGKAPEKAAKPFKGPVVKIPAQVIAPTAKALEIAITLPAGMEFNPEAPSSYHAAAVDPAVVAFQKSEGNKLAARMELPFSGLKEGSTTVNVDLDVFYCSEGNQALCFFKEVRLEIPVTVAPGGRASLNAELKIAR